MDTYTRGARRARLRLIVAAAVAVAVLVGIGVATVASLDGGDSSAASQESAPSGSSSPSAEQGAKGTGMTPARAKPVKLLKPKRHKNGVSRGFPGNGMGAISTAVYFLEEYAWLDDAQARRQMETITSPNSTDSVTAAVSKVRKSREAIGLDPAGGMPPGLTVTTRVEAVRGKTIAKNDDGGPVVFVSLWYDRYATGPDAQPDQDPLTDQLDNVILSFEDGEWMLTEEQRYLDKRDFGVPYNPDSPDAWADGWWQVVHE